MIHVLRLGHRPFRDQRITTHCCLVARAFGASKVIYSGERDQKLEQSINKVEHNWGGKFDIEHKKNCMPVLNGYKKRGYKIVHLTMYGLPVQKNITKLRKLTKLLVVVGGEKVPPEVYQESDYNIAVASQPHSEVSALAILLHEYFKGKELDKRFSNARLRITPQAKGKFVLK